MISTNVTILGVLTFIAIAGCIPQYQSIKPVAETEASAASLCTSLGPKPTDDQLIAYHNQLMARSYDPEAVKQKSIGKLVSSTCLDKRTASACTGWRAAFTANPPNRYGGYEGARTIWVWFHGSRAIANGSSRDYCYIY